jgi:hypothetical protein
MRDFEMLQTFPNKAYMSRDQKYLDYSHFCVANRRRIKSETDHMLTKFVNCSAVELCQITDV